MSSVDFLGAWRFVAAPRHSSGDHKASNYRIPRVLRQRGLNSEKELGVLRLETKFNSFALYTNGVPRTKTLAIFNSGVNKIKSASAPGARMPLRDSIPMRWAPL